jgi:hypothetical protein
VKLVHVLGEPIPPPVPPDQVREEDVRRHHEYVTERMQALMLKALAIADAKRDRPPK